MRQTTLILLPLLLTFAIAVFGQVHLKIEEQGEPTPEMGVPKGTATIHDQSITFLSEDGKVEITAPRTDLPAPGVKSSFDNGVFTYVITNGLSAKAPIEIIRGGWSDSVKVTEVQADPRLQFTGFGWIAGLSGGIKPGETAILKVKTDTTVTTRIKMEFLNDHEPFILPENTPYGLSLLVFSFLKAHDSVGVMVTGPGQPIL